MSVDTYQERESLMKEREAVLEAGFSRFAGDTPASIKEMRDILKEKYKNG